MRKILWIISFVCALYAIFDYMGNIGRATGAPQQAAIAGMALVVAVIPYIMARAWTEIKLAAGTTETEKKEPRTYAIGKLKLDTNAIIAIIAVILGIFAVVMR